METLDLCPPRYNARGDAPQTHNDIKFAMTFKKLALIHTSATLVPVFQTLCNELLPNVVVLNIVDESLIQDVIECGALVPTVARRIHEHVRAAEHQHADRIMVTCSSVGRAVEESQAFAAVPVLRVDQPMCDYAVTLGQRIGVIATLKTTLEPTLELIERRATAAGKKVEIVARLCDGAFAALKRGDTQQHDHMVREQIQALADSVDAIVLAQASMTRIADQLLDGKPTTPILSSPRLAIESLLRS